MEEYNALGVMPPGVTAGLDGHGSIVLECPPGGGGGVTMSVPVDPIGHEQLRRVAPHRRRGMRSLFTRRFEVRAGSTPEEVRRWLERRLVAKNPDKYSGEVTAAGFRLRRPSTTPRNVPPEVIGLGEHTEEVLGNSR